MATKLVIADFSGRDVSLSLPLRLLRRCQHVQYEYSSDCHLRITVLINNLELPERRLQSQLRDNFLSPMCNDDASLGLSRPSPEPSQDPNFRIRLRCTLLERLRLQHKVKLR